MKESHLLTGPPVTLSNSQPMRQARHSYTAQAYQDGLQRINKPKVVYSGYKACKTCSTIKAFDEFRINITTRDKRRGMCRACECRIAKARYKDGLK